MTPAKPKQSTVLIVDDEDVLRMIFRVILEKEGCIVREARSGNEAWTELENHRIDLIVSDVRMPDGDGLTLLERVHQLESGHPHIILVTGYCDLTVADALARGATAMFSKPFDYGLFRQTVREVLARTHGTPAR